MDFSFIQILLVVVVTFIAAIDQFNFLESLYQPIVLGPVVGAILGDVETGLIVGGSYQLMQIGSMPVGGAQPPNAVIGGIMATVFAIGLDLKDPAQALGLAVPFALFGQYAVTLLFAFMSPLMSKADRYAEEANPEGIVKINYFAMLILGLLFSLVVLLGLLVGVSLGETLQNLSSKVGWLMAGLSAAGGMMRYVGFAILMRIMLSKDLWGFYFAGFAAATIVGSIDSLKSSALLIIAFIGAAIAINDYQTNVKVKSLAGSNNGGDEDGI